MNKFKKALTLVVVFALLFVTTTSMAVKAEETITIHAKAPSEWATPGLWAWSAPDGTNVFSTWPGEKLTPDENNEGWFYYSVPSWVNSIIINKGVDGGKQTVDVSVEAKNLWITVTEAGSDGKFAAEVVYEAPEGFQVAAADTAETTEVAETQDAEPATGDATPVFVMICLAAISGITFIALKGKKESKCF